MVSRARSALAAEAVVITDPGGEILRIDEGASSLLNIGTAHRAGGTRNLAHFFVAQRGEILADIQRAALGDAPIHREAVLRPRDRPPIPVTITMVAVREGVQCALRPHPRPA